MNYLEKAFLNLKGCYFTPKNLVKKVQNKEILNLLLINPPYEKRKI